MTVVYSNAQIFNGHHLINGFDLVVKQGQTIDLVPSNTIVENAKNIDFNGKILSPGYVEIQANGGGGVLFNEQPNIEGICTILNAHRQFGTVAMLPTFITDDFSKMAQAVQTIAEGVEKNLKGLIGGHFEGPFINVEKKGAHPAHYIRLPTKEDIKLFTQYNLGHSQITLAPEMVDKNTIHTLHKHGLKISAGHTMAGKNEMLQAHQCGLSGVTHLYNAMPSLQGREPSVIGSAIVLNLFCGLIVDGIHSDPFSLQSALKMIGPERLMLVTDSMHTIGAPHIREFMLIDQKVFVENDCLRTAEGTLAGAHITMEQTVKNAVRLMNASKEDALKMAITTPANFINRPDLSSIINRNIDDVLILEADLSLTGFLSQF